MGRLKSMIKSMPVISDIARRSREWGRPAKPEEPLGGFYTLSPDALVALVKSFNIQRSQLSQGHDLLKGHGYYEFGMFRGFSFWFAEQLSKEYAKADFRLMGFDSFEGLPQPQLPREAAVFKKGDFCGTYETVTNNLTKWKTDSSRITLYKGFYSEELFGQLRKKTSFPPVSICLIDVDLYESCIPVLDFIKEYLVPGSILLFDDYNQLGEDNNSGERRALIEFEQRNPRFRKEHLFDYGWEGVAFRVVSV
jgi:O-methyltransferase